MKHATKSWASRDGNPALLSALAAAGALVVPALAAAQTTDWATPAWDQAAAIPVPAGLVHTVTPATIPSYDAFDDATGVIASFQPGGATTTSANAFFTPFGNGRSCFSCHQPQNGWALGPDSVEATYLATGGKDAMFAPVDGADCPDLAEDACSSEGFTNARRQLFTKANFRIFLPVPAGAEYTVRVVSDPYGCDTSATYGLPAGLLSLYRRPLPSANVVSLDPEGDAAPVGIFPDGFNIMWDAREPTLQSQFQDALKIHAQAPDLDPKVVAAATAQGVSFQQGLYVAQSSDLLAHDLNGNGANGGPRYLPTIPTGIASVLETPPQAFTLFTAWSSLTASQGPTDAARASIARGEALFNSKPITIVDVPGINDLAGLTNPQPGFCGFCHNDGQRGNDFFLDPKSLGIGDNRCAAPNTCGGQTPGARDALPPPSDLPLLSFICPRDKNGQSTIHFFTNPVDAKGHPCTGDACGYDELLTTDPGLALITGKCADLGRMKVPILRGLASRAPYFHDGRAATLQDVVDFYDQRFGIGFTADEEQDLIAFLNTL